MYGKRLTSVSFQEVFTQHASGMWIQLNPWGSAPGIHWGLHPLTPQHWGPCPLNPLGLCPGPHQGRHIMRRRVANQFGCVAGHKPHVRRRGDFYCKINVLAADFSKKINLYFEMIAKTITYTIQYKTKSRYVKRQFCTPPQSVAPQQCDNDVPLVRRPSPQKEQNAVASGP